jgi:Xaa-Pro aminopeptidase
MKTKLIHEVRAVKTKRELANLIKAQRISEKVLTDALGELSTGVTETGIAEFVIKRFKKYGAPVLSFPPIVAFGKNSANIHHEPNNTKLKRGDTVMFDIGTTVNHYCSDMTRTYFFGEPSAKQKKVYLDVLKAQELAVKKLEKGERRAWIIDKTAREFLAKKYKNNFKHGLGHGVGTVIHEWPNFKPKSEDIIPAGCVMTVEPGIYLKGLGGVRVEDMYLITKKGLPAGRQGAKCITKLPKNLKDAILK